MGRPINKKFFGNRNVGTGGSGDNAIGGEGVASVTINTVGSYTSALPTVTFSDPNLPTGVTALGTVHGNAKTAVATAAGSGYHNGDVLTLPTGSGIVAPATFTVSTIKVVSITLKNGGSANDTGDIFTFSHASLSTPIKVRVTASSGGVASAVEIVDSGVWTATGALPAATDAGGFTRTQFYGSQDMNGQNLEVNLTGWGVDTVTVATQGDYTSISSGAKATTASPAGGTGATLTVTYGVSGVAIDEKGSGYTSVADAAPTFSAGAAAGTSVLTTDNNTPYSSGNQENAIIVSAQTTSGGSDKYGDIIAQKGSRRFRVRTADGTATCALVAKSNVAVNEMTIIATDANNNTYYVTKLTARKATLTQIAGGSNYVYSTDQVAPWSFAAASGIFVQVANA